MADASMDIVSTFDKQEVANAVNAAAKEIHNRYDFKGVGASVELTGEVIKMEANSEDRCKAVLDVVQTDQGTDLVPQHLDVGRFTALAGVVEHRRVDRDDCGDPSDLAAHLEPGRASEPGDRSRAGISVSSAKPMMTGAQRPPLRSGW